MRLVVPFLALALASPAFASDLRVMDPDSEPVEGARVEVVQATRSSDLLTRLVTPQVVAQTGPEGEVGLRLPAIEVERLILVDHPRYEPWSAVLARGQRDALIRLAPGLTWRGRILFEEGNPTEGTACASWTQEFGRFEKTVTWRRCTEIDGEGRFTLEGIVEGALDLQIEVPGYLPLTLRGAPESLGELRIQPGHMLKGVVLDSAGDPLDGASVGQRNRPARVETGPRGGFEIAVEGLPLRLEVQAGGFHPASVLVKDDVASGPLEIVLQPREGALGLAFADDGAPLDRLTSRSALLLPAGVREEEQALETQDGEIRLALSAPGTYRFRFETPGYRPVQTAEIEVGPGEVVDLGALFFTRGSGVRGAVVDGESGVPVEGVEVELLPTGTRAFEAARRRSLPRAVTEETTGEFTFFGLEAGRYELRMRRFGYSTYSASVIVEEDEVTDVGEIALDAGVPVRGRLVGRDGEARSGLTVRFFDAQQEAPFPIAEATSGLDGKFDGPSLAPGAYRLQVSGKRLLLSQEIPVSHHDSELELELVVGGTTLRGIVRRDGRPVPGGVIRLSSSLDPGQHRGKLLLNAPDLGPDQGRYGFPESVVGAAIQPDGRFLIEDAPTGLLWATVIDSLGRSGRQLMVPDTPAPEVVVDIGGVKLRGRVIDERSGIGLEALLRLRDDLGLTVSTTRSGDHGIFELEDLEEGSYALLVAAEGYVSRTLFAVEVWEGVPPLEVELQTGESGALEVRLQRSDGGSVPGSLATLLDEAGSMVRSLTTDADGVRLYEDLPPGTYTLVWSDTHAGTGASSPIKLRAGDRASWNAPLGSGSLLAVHCEPALCAGAAVELLALHTVTGVQIAPYLSGFSSSMRFSSAGEITLGRLSPGRYLLTLWVGGKRFHKAFEAGGSNTAVVFP